MCVCAGGCGCVCWVFAQKKTTRNMKEKTENKTRNTRNETDAKTQKGRTNGKTRTTKKRVQTMRGKRTN